MLPLNWCHIFNEILFQGGQSMKKQKKKRRRRSWMYLWWSREEANCQVCECTLFWIITKPNNKTKEHKQTRKHVYFHNSTSTSHLITNQVKQLARGNEKYQTLRNNPNNTHIHTLIIHSTLDKLRQREPRLRITSYVASALFDYSLLVITYC